MHKQVYKPKNNESRAAATSEASKSSDDNPGLAIVDNRVECIRLMRLAQMATTNKKDDHAKDKRATNIQGMYGDQTIDAGSTIQNNSAASAPIQRTPSSLKAQFGNHPQFNLTPLQQLQHPTWAAIVNNLKSYFTIEDDNWMAITTYLPVHYQRTMSLLHEGLGKFPEEINKVALDLLERMEQESIWGEEQYGVKIYKRKTGPYTLKKKYNEPGKCDLEVFTPSESDRVGYATFYIEQVAEKALPTGKDAYTIEHVLARFGKVAHLTHLYNETLTRDGPADIYSGIGGLMLKTLEEDAESMGVKLVYLEPAGSDVRIEPDSNKKIMMESKGFYEKYGYKPDAEQEAHNIGIAAKKFQEMTAGVELSQMELDELITGELKFLSGGILIKELD